MEQASFRPIVGIDLGTTNSGIAYIRGGEPGMLASPDGKTIIPSVVLIDLQGNVVVGQDAKDSMAAMPDRSIAAVKRKMGSEEQIMLGGQAFLPQEISALILKELKSYADAWFGPGEKEAVITVPAYFTDEQRRATKEAGELAGFVVERIINEPTAAALSFGLEHLEEDRHFLVYDLGGGTFDVSVVEMCSGLLEVKASTGNASLGGEDFDWTIVDWFAERMMEQHGVDPRGDLRARALLKQEAERVKIALSEQDVAHVALPLVTVENQKPIGLVVDLTREQLARMIADRLEETVVSVRTVVAEAGLALGDIDEVLLVGGSTRIPLVRELLRDLFGKNPRTDVHPDEAVALGAAVQAGLKSGALSNSGLVATDVAPFSMGVAVVKDWKGMGMRPGGFAPIIPRNTTIPVTRSETYYTAAPGQTAVEIEVYQGEHEWVKYNHLLGTFMLSGLPDKGEQPEAVEVTFRYNLNGILEVSAKSVTTGKEMTVTVQDALDRSSKATFAESVEKLERLWAGEAGEDEEWPEGDDRDDDELDFEEEDDADLDLEEDPLPTMLHEEGAKLRARAESLLPSLEGASRTKAEQIMRSLHDALESNDIESLERAVNEATDALIDLEY